MFKPTLGAKFVLKAAGSILFLLAGGWAVVTAPRYISFDEPVPAWMTLTLVPFVWFVLVVVFCQWLWKHFLYFRLRQVMRDIFPSTASSARPYKFSARTPDGLTADVSGFDSYCEIAVQAWVDDQEIVYRIGGNVSSVILPRGGTIGTEGYGFNVSVKVLRYILKVLTARPLA